MFEGKEVQGFRNKQEWGTRVSSSLNSSLYMWAGGHDFFRLDFGDVLDTCGILNFGRKWFWLGQLFQPRAEHRAGMGGFGPIYPHPKKTK